jgi:hypothetical protein
MPDSCVCLLCTLPSVFSPSRVSSKNGPPVALSAFFDPILCFASLVVCVCMCMCVHVCIFMCGSLSLRPSLLSLFNPFLVLCRLTFHLLRVYFLLLSVSHIATFCTFDATLNRFSRIEQYEHVLEHSQFTTSDWVKWMSIGLFLLFCFLFLLVFVFVEPLLRSALLSALSLKLPLQSCSPSLSSFLTLALCL